MPTATRTNGREGPRCLRQFRKSIYDMRNRHARWLGRSRRLRAVQETFISGFINRYSLRRRYSCHYASASGRDFMLLHDHSGLAKVVAHAHRAPLKSCQRDGKCEIPKRRSKIHFRATKKGLMRWLVLARNVKRCVYIYISTCPIWSPHISLRWQRPVGCGVKPVDMITHFS